MRRQHAICALECLLLAVQLRVLRDCLRDALRCRRLHCRTTWQPPGLGTLAAWAASPKPRPQPRQRRQRRQQRKRPLLRRRRGASPAASVAASAAASHQAAPPHEEGGARNAAPAEQDVTRQAEAASPGASPDAARASNASGSEAHHIDPIIPPTAPLEMDGADGNSGGRDTGNLCYASNAACTGQAGPCVR